MVTNTVLLQDQETSYNLENTVLLQDKGAVQL